MGKEAEFNLKDLDASSQIMIYFWISRELLQAI